jgi:F-box/leucine-rich repeat protein 7
MGSLFTAPEEMVVSQGEKSMCMFFIASGESQILHKNSSGKERAFSKLLIGGDHFGEVGLIYDCPRTCTVMTSDYNILARLSKIKLRMLCSDYPLLKPTLQSHTFTYKDEFKSFMSTIF